MHEQNDNELERYLDGDSDESRRYAELGDESPPPEVDARILAEAERAVKVRSLDSRRAPPFKAFAWAAIVVLSFSLVLNIVFQQAVQDPGAELESMAGRADAPVRRDVLQQEQEVPASVQAKPMSPESRDAGGVSLYSLGEASGIEKRASPVAEAPTESAVAAKMLAVDAADDRLASIQLVADYLQQAQDEDTGLAELERILELYEVGEIDAAMTALGAFRENHPQHAVSEALEEQGL